MHQSTLICVVISGRRLVGAVGPDVLCVPVGVEGLAKDNVLLNCARKDPCLLWDVSKLSVQLHRALLDRDLQNIISGKLLKSLEDIVTYVCIVV